MDIRETIRKQSDVALGITKRLLQGEAKNSNVVVSPLSIHVVLSLIAAGSSGQTLDQLLLFLKSNSVHQLNHFASEIASMVSADGSLGGGPRLAFANGVWIEQSISIKHSFKQVVDTAYRANLCRADFKYKVDEAASEVNSWAEKQTNGLITEILPPESIDDLTTLVLANALYFKATWEQKFEPIETQEHEFHLLDGTSVHVPFMSSENNQYIAAFEGFKVLSLPYKQGHNQRRFSMCLFLPDNKHGLPYLIHKIDSESGLFIDRHIPHEKVRVGEFKVPKFKFSFGVELSNVLKGLGLELPFRKGGLLEMVEDSQIGKKLYVSKIFHKSFIEVAEEGTEAAAVSVGVVKMQCGRVRCADMVDFVADHPFLYAIREDNTGVLLFIGQVLNPLV